MPVPADATSSWVSQKSRAFALLALELASELYLLVEAERSPQDMLELQLDWLTASMKVVRLEVAEAAVEPSTLKLTPSQLQQKMASLQQSLSSTLRSLHAYPVPNSSSTPESPESSTGTNTETPPD